MSNINDVDAIEYQASEVISRLEEAVEKNSDNNSAGSTWNNPSGFLSSPKSPETILSLIQVSVIKIKFNEK